MVGRVEIEADDVADLLDEEGIGRELEVLLPVGLEVERGPDALDRGLGDPGGLGHGTAGPVRAAVGGAGLERLPQQCHDGVVRDRARPARPVFVVEAHEALGAEAFTPLADRLATDAEPLGHRRIVQALGAQEHDFGAAHQAGGQAARPGQRSSPRISGPRACPAQRNAVGDDPLDPPVGQLFLHKHANWNFAYPYQRDRVRSAISPLRRRVR